MNTKAELQWWIEFGQKNLERIKHKTRDRLCDELYGKMENYCSFWGATPSDYGGFSTRDKDRIAVIEQEYLSEHQKGAEAFVEDLKGTLIREKSDPFDRLRTPDLNSVEVKFYSFIPKTTDGVFNPTISVDSEPDQLVYFFMSMLLEGTKIADFKDCAYCSKLFLQVSREKKFCTRNCAANSAKG